MSFLLAHWKEIAAACVLIAEQILPFLPCKANSTTQVILNAAKQLTAKGQNV